MHSNRLFHTTRSVLAVISAISLMIMSACGEQPVSPQGSTTNSTTVARGAEVHALPRSGKQVAAVAPLKAVFGMIWLNTAENREYIFDGTQWVPHDPTIDFFYTAKNLNAKDTPKTVALDASEVCLDGDPACTPTGAHGKHGNFDCKVCHNVGGRLAFAKTGSNALAYAVGKPAPTFNATDKTCSNIACHGVPTGTFSYYFPDGAGDPQLNTVSYGGGAPRPTPSWYATGALACAACHDNPPLTGSTGSNVWHSGAHAGSITAISNQCQFCHPDATGTNGQGTSITNQALHVNGTVNVQATFKSSCFGCH